MYLFTAKKHIKRIFVQESVPCGQKLGHETINYCLDINLVETREKQKAR